nr:hypothetical protein [Tanacetum cinerariifolium]
IVSFIAENLFLVLAFLVATILVKLLSVEHKNQKKSNEMHYPRFTKVIIHHFMSKDPSIPRRNKFGALLSIELTNEEIGNSKAYTEYYAITIGEAAPKPKASARRTRSGSDTSITPPTAAAIPRPPAAVTLRLTTAAKGKQTAKASKAKSQSTLSEPSGSDADQGTGSKSGVPDIPTDESEEELSWNFTDDKGENDVGKDGDNDEEDERDDSEEGEEDYDDENKDADEKDDADEDQEVVEHDDKDDTEESKDDDEEGESDEHESDEETQEEESFDPVPQTLEDSEDEYDGKEDLDLNTGEEERHDEEEEKDELYRDVNINQERGLQGTLEVEDTHVTLTLVKPDGQQESSSVSSQFVTSMLNPTIDVGMESIFETTSRIDAQTPTSTNQFAGAVSAILGIVQHYIDQQMNKAVQVSVRLQSDRLCEEAQRENDEFLRTVDENIRKIIKELVKKQDKDEEPSAGPDRGSKRRREGKEPELASTPSKTATKSTGMSTTRCRSRQASASESAVAEEPMQTTSQIEEPSHPEFETDHDWNKTLPAVYESIQPWISKLAKQADTRSSFNELMDTPLDYSNFIMNWLRPLPLIPDNRGRRVIPFAYFINNDLEYLRGGASSRKYTTSVTKTKAADYEHNKWIKDLVPRTMWIQEPTDYDKHALWGASQSMLSRNPRLWNGITTSLWIGLQYDRRVEDLQLGVESYQKKLNLTKPDTYRSDLKHKEAYTTNSNPRGFIYENKDKQNRLMRIDELHKFSNGTLTDVRTTLDDRLKLSDFLPSPEYDSILYEDFSEVHALPLTNNEDKVFNPCMIIHENLFEVIIQVTPDKNVKKISISNASLILEDFNPPLSDHELPFHKEVLGSKTLLSFSSENEEKVFNLGILTFKGVHTSLLPELSHQGPKAFKVIKYFETPMEIFSCSYGEDICILDVSCLHLYPP